MIIKTKFNLNEWVYIYNKYPVLPQKAREYKEGEKIVYYIGYDRIKINYYSFDYSAHGEKKQQVFGYNRNKIWKCSDSIVKTYAELKKLTAYNIFGKQKNTVYKLKNLSKENHIALYFKVL